MYRIIGGKVYGVLTDFDLSSWTDDLASDRTKTSQQRTGTPPYMAFEILKETDPVHLYRHDVESLLYIMLVLATHYEIETPGKRKPGGRLRMRQGDGELPFQSWFDQPSCKELSSLKYNFLSSTDDIPLSPNFWDFRDWLSELHLSFRLGLRSEGAYKDMEKMQAWHRRMGRGRGRGRGRGGVQSRGEAIPQFDNETLGGHVSYSTLVDPARYLTGKLRGLIVRYESEPGASD